MHTDRPWTRAAPEEHRPRGVGDVRRDGRRGPYASDREPDITDLDFDNVKAAGAAARGQAGVDARAGPLPSARTRTCGAATNVAGLGRGAKATGPEPPLQEWRSRARGKRGPPRPERTPAVLLRPARPRAVRSTDVGARRPGGEPRPVPVCPGGKRRCGRLERGREPDPRSEVIAGLARCRTGVRARRGLTTAARSAASGPACSAASCSGPAGGFDAGPGLGAGGWDGRAERPGTRAGSGDFGGAATSAVGGGDFRRRRLQVAAGLGGTATSRWAPEPPRRGSPRPLLSSAVRVASSPDLFVVYKNCGSEVSPYITECPYCGDAPAQAPRRRSSATARSPSRSREEAEKARRARAIAAAPAGAERASVRHSRPWADADAGPASSLTFGYLLLSESSRAPTSRSPGRSTASGGG